MSQYDSENEAVGVPPNVGPGLVISLAAVISAGIDPRGKNQVLVKSLVYCIQLTPRRWHWIRLRRFDEFLGQEASWFVHK